MWEMDVLLIAGTITEDDKDEHEHEPLYRVREAIDQIIEGRIATSGD
jgi:hypothetical protein